MLVSLGLAEQWRKAGWSTFSGILSFPQVKSKTSKTPTANRPAGGRPNPPVRNGGKVNLGLRRRLREQAKRYVIEKLKNNVSTAFFLDFVCCLL